ncbi:MAG TPA: peptidoglycan-binding protein [Terriglobales bacterium]|nr:peptidoglycan-binding protein [Terriglobales bacterium]
MTRSPEQSGNATSGQAHREGKERSTTGQGASEKKGSASREHEQKSTTGQAASKKSEPTKGSASKEESKNGSENKKRGMNEDRNAAQGSKNEKSTAGQASPSKNERTTTGQGSPERNEGSKAQSTQGRPTANQPAQNQTQVPATGKQNQTTGAATQGRENATEQSNASVRTEAGTTISAQQQTKIQQSVLSAKNAPRQDHVDFEIRTNTVVPSHVHVAEISAFPILVETFPRYREDSFFVVEDEIVIVDHRHRIVDVVPAGPRSHVGRTRSTTTTTMDLSEPEIRELQQVLIERGFYHGHVDGVFGPEMREAVISFQRKEGLEANGSIDTKTVNALGLSGRIGQSDRGAENQSDKQNGRQAPSGSSTTGQAPASQQNSSGQANQPPENRSQNGPTNAQKNNPSAQQRPKANGEAQHNKQSGSSPSTTGQGGAMQNEPTKNKQKGSSVNEKGSEMKSQPSGNSQQSNPTNR